MQIQTLDKRKSLVILTLYSSWLEASNRNISFSEHCFCLILTLEGEKTYFLLRQNIKVTIFALQTSFSCSFVFSENNNMDRQRYISTCNTRFPESCRVTFKLFSGFAKRQNIHRTWTLYVCIIIMIKAFNEKDVETVLYLNCRKMETSLGCWIATALSLLFPFIAATCILTFICSSPSFFHFFGHRCVHYLQKQQKPPSYPNNGKVRVDRAILHFCFHYVFPKFHKSCLILLNMIYTWSTHSPLNALKMQFSFLFLNALRFLLPPMHYSCNKGHGNP